MKSNLTFSTHNISLPTGTLHPGSHLQEFCTQLHQAHSLHYQTDYAALNLPFDAAYQQRIRELVAQKKKLRPTMLVIIGIGGSNLGTQAIHEAYYGSLQSANAPLLVHYADTIDPDTSALLYQQVRTHLEQGNTVLLSVASKSGTTIESLIHFSILFDVLRTFLPTTFQEYIVITTDVHSPLWHFGKQHGIAVLEIPKKVGGRFSVLSAIGLFPLALMDIPIDELVAGAQAITPSLLASDSGNIALQSATVMYQQYQHNIHIQDMFVFSCRLKSFATWYRQLLAESIGKEKDIHGTRVERGITPTVSVGTTDLHSVGQLYWAGPHDKCSTFVTVQTYEADATIPPNDSTPPALHNGSLSTVFDTIIQGVFAAYNDLQRPYAHLCVPAITPYYMGQLLQYKIIEIFYVGYLLEINPFDQPQVELYKTYTKKFLKL